MVADLEGPREEEHERGKDVSKALLCRNAEYDSGESCTDKQLIDRHVEHSEHGEDDHDVADAGCKQPHRGPAAAIDRSVTRWPRPAAMRRVAMTPKTRSIAALIQVTCSGSSAVILSFSSLGPPTNAAKAMSPVMVPIVQLCSRAPVISLTVQSRPSVHGSEI